MVVFIRRYIIHFLILLGTLIWIAVFQVPDRNLHIIACDVGQGDAILATYGNFQVLTDGGPNSKVLDCLSKHIPFWDRQIEVVISTHPDADHSTGLIDVIKRYNVGSFIKSSLEVSTQVWGVLEKEVGSKGIKVVTANRGTIIRGGLMQLDILHPPEGYESAKTNEHSIVYILKYGDFEAVFTGDIEDDVSDLVATLNLPEGVEYIKVPHHGSKNGLSENLLKSLMPKIAVISVGRNNVYKHPHQEVLDLLAKYNARILRTDEKGDVEITTNGKAYWIEK